MLHLRQYCSIAYTKGYDKAFHPHLRGNPQIVAISRVEGQGNHEGLPWLSPES